MLGSAAWPSGKQVKIITIFISGGEEAGAGGEGSGYLGQHLLATFASAAGCLDVAFTLHSQGPLQPLLDAHPSVRTFRISLRSGDGFEAVSASFSQIHVVVNCAAISVPWARACEMDPPTAIVPWLPMCLLQRRGRDIAGEHVWKILSCCGEIHC